MTDAGETRGKASGAQGGHDQVVFPQNVTSNYVIEWPTAQ